MKKTFATVSMLVVGLAITTLAFAADSSVGTWKLNVAKSKFNGYVLKSRTDVREATADGGVTVTREAQLGDGTAVKGSHIYKYDGKDYPVTELAFDALSVKRIDGKPISSTVVFDKQ